MATLTITELTWGGLVPATGGVATPTLKYEYDDGNGNIITSGAKVTWERVRIATNGLSEPFEDPWMVNPQSVLDEFRVYDWSGTSDRSCVLVPINECPEGIPTDWWQALRVRNIGPGTSFAGGFYLNRVGNNNEVFSGNTYICSFVAWVPADRYLYPTNNQLGDGGYHRAISSVQGDARWRLYGSETYFGPGASSSFYYGLRPLGDGTPENPLDFWVTGVTVCQVTNLNPPSNAPALDTTTGALTIPPTTATQARALEWGAVKVTVEMNGLKATAVSAPEQAPALDWVTVEPMKGGDSTKLASQTVKITATENRSLTDTRSGFVSYKTAGNAFATLRFAQKAATVSFGTLTAQLSYPTAAAKGGSVSPTVTWILPFGFNGNTSNGGTITQAADGTITVTRKDSHVPTTITGVTTSVSYSMPTANGAILNSTSTGEVTVPSLGTTVTDGNTIRATIKASVSVSISAGSTWGGATASKSATATTDVLQERNVKTATSYGAVSLSVSPSSISAEATGDTFSLSASATQTKTDTYTSGSYNTTVYPTISFSEGSTSWLTKGLSNGGNATYEVDVNNGTSSRSGTITVTATGAGSKSASKTVTVSQSGAEVSFSEVSVWLTYDDHAEARGDTLYPALSWSMTYGVNGATSGSGIIESSNYTTYSGVSVSVSYKWGNTPITGGSLDSSTGKVITPSAGNTISTGSVTLGDVTATVTVTIAAGSSVGNSTTATVNGSDTDIVWRLPNTATATREINLSLDKTEFTAAGGSTTIRATGTISYLYDSGSTTPGSGLPTTFTPSVSLSSTDGFAMNGSSFYCTSHDTTIHTANRYTDVQAAFPSTPTYTGVTFTDGSTRSVTVKQTGNYCTGSIEVSVDKSSLSAAGERTKVYGQVVYSFSSGSKLYNPASLSSSPSPGFTFAGRTGDTSVYSGASSPITTYVNLTAASRGTTAGSARSIVITASDNTQSPSVGYTKASSKNITVTQVANAVTGTTYGNITITLPFTSKSVSYDSNSFSIDAIATQSVSTTYTSGSTSTSSVNVSDSLTYSSNVSWITVSKDEDDASGYAWISENTSSSSRSGTITITASGNGKSVSETITVTQAAMPEWGLYASPSSLSITGGAYSGSFYVTKKTTSGTEIPFTSTSQVKATSGVAWLTASSLSLTSSGQIMVSFSATANTASSARTGQIGVQSTENTSKAVGVTITQAAVSTIALSVSSSIISLDSESGQSATVSISKTVNGGVAEFTSASQIRVDSKPSWVSVSLSVSSGAIIATISTTSANTSSSARGGLVNFISTEDSSKSVSVTVSQSGAEVVSSGTLTFRLYHSYPSQIISQYFNNVTGNEWWVSIYDNYDDISNEPFYECIGYISNVSSSGNYVYIKLRPYTAEVEDVISNLRNGDMMEMDTLYIGGENGDSPWDSWAPHFVLYAEDNNGDYATEVLADALESVMNGNDEQLVIQMY